MLLTLWWSKCWQKREMACQSPSKKRTPYPVQNLKRRVMAWAVKLRVNPKLVRVQDMTRKWGSCSSSGTVTLATDLIDRDDCFQDYVIVHELLHLRFSTHGRMFKALLTAHVPGWRKYDADRQHPSGPDIPRLSE